MKLFSRQATSTEAGQPMHAPAPASRQANSRQHHGGQRLKRFKLVGVLSIAALLGSLLASVAALAVLHPTAAQAQTNFTPSVTITVPADSNLANIEFTVSFADGSGGTDGNGADCSTGIADLTYTSTATGTTTTSDSLPSLVNLPASGTAGMNECVYGIDITLKNPGTGASADRLKIVRPGAKPATVSAAASAATDTWAEFPDFSSYMPRDCGATNWAAYGYVVFPFVDDGSGSNVFAADDAFGQGGTSLGLPVAADAGGVTEGEAAITFPVPNMGTWRGSDWTGCRLPNQASWEIRYTWPEEFVAAGNSDLKLVRSPAFSDAATGTLTESAPSTLMVYETTYVHTSGGGGGGGTARTMFEPEITVLNVPNGHEGATFTFTYTVDPSTPDDIETPDGTDMTCSAEATEVFHVGVDDSAVDEDNMPAPGFAAVTSGGAPTLTGSPEGTTDICTYEINRPDASNTRYLGLNSSSDRIVTINSKTSTFEYLTGSAFTPEVTINVPMGAGFAGIGFTVEFSFVSGIVEAKCSEDKTVLYVSNDSGGVELATTNPPQTAARLVDVAGGEMAGEMGQDRCVYSVSVSLTDPADSSRLMRDPSASAPGNVDATSGSNSVTDTWIATPMATPLSEFTPGVTIADVPNGYPGATFTFSYPVNTVLSPANCTPLADAMETFTVGADDSGSTGFASVTSSVTPTLVGSPAGTGATCTYDIDSPRTSDTRILALVAPTGAQTLTEASHDVVYSYDAASAFSTSVTINVPTGAGFAGIGFTVVFSRVSGGGTDGADLCSADTTVLYVSNNSGGVALGTDQADAILVDAPIGVTGDRCVYSVTVSLTDPADSSRLIRDPSASALGNVQSMTDETVTDTWVDPSSIMDPTFAPNILFSSLGQDFPGGTSNNPYAGETITFGFAGSGDSRTGLTDHPAGCSTGITFVTYTIQDDGTLDSDGTELVRRPVGATTDCSYFIVKNQGAQASSGRSVGLISSGSQSIKHNTGDEDRIFLYGVASKFSPMVSIGVPDATYSGVEFLVTYTYGSGGTRLGNLLCSPTTTVLYEVNSSGTAVPATGHTAASLVDNPASAGGGAEACIYNVSVDLINSNGKRMARDSSATAPSTVRDASRAVSDTWVEDTSVASVNYPNIDFTIPGGTTNNPYAGETITFEFNSDDPLIYEPFNADHTNPSGCSANGSTFTYTIQSDGSLHPGNTPLVRLAPGQTTGHCIYVRTGDMHHASSGRSLGVESNFGEYFNSTSQSLGGMQVYGASSFFEPVVNISVPDDTFSDIKFRVTFTRTSGLEPRCSETFTTTYEVHSSGTVIFAPQYSTDPAETTDVQTVPRLVRVPGGPERVVSDCVYSVTVALDDPATDSSRLERQSSVATAGNVRHSSPSVSDVWVAPAPAPDPEPMPMPTPMPDPDPAPMPAPAPMPDPAPAPDPSSPTFMPDLTIEVPTGSNFANIVFTVSFADGSGGTDGSGAGCSNSIADLTYTSAADGTTSTSDSIPLLVNLPTGGTAGMHECEYVAGVAPDSANASKIERAGAIPTFTAASPAATDIWAEPVDRSYTPPACSGDLYKPGFVVVFPFVDDGDGRNVFAGGESDFTPPFRVTFQNRANVFDPSRSIRVPNTSRVAKFSIVNCLFANGAFDAVFPQRVEVASGDFMGAELTLSAGSTASKRITSGDPLHTVVYETTYKVPEDVGGGLAPTPLSTFMPEILFDDVPARYAGDTFTFTYEAGDGTDASIVMSDGSDTKCSATAAETFTVRSDGSITSNGRQTLTDSPEGTALRCFYVVNRPEASSSRLLAVTNTGGQTTTGLSPNPGNNFAYGESRTFAPTVDIGVPRGSGFAGIGFTVAFSYVAGSGTVDDKCSEAKTVLYVSNSSGGVRLASTPRQTAATLVDVGANSRGFESSPCVYSVSVSLTDPDEIRVLRSGSAPGNVQASAGTVSDTWVATGVGVVSARPVAQPEPLIRPAGSVGELPVTVSLTVPSVAGRIFGSGDVFEVNVSVPGPCGLDTQLFGGVQASDGVAYGVPASQPGRSQLIGPGTRQVNNRAAYSLASYVESGGQRTPCELRVTQLTTPLGCAMRGASQDLLDRLYLSAVWSQGAVGYDISVSYDCTQLGSDQGPGTGDGTGDGQLQQGWITLEQGWMILPFNGEDGTTPSELALNLDNAITGIWAWDAGAQSWRGWAADGAARSLTRLNRGDVLMVYAPVSVSVNFSPSTLLDTQDTAGSLTIAPQYSLQVFGGGASVPLTSLFGTQPGSVAVLFRWDATNQSWHYYLPGRAPLASVDIPWFTTIGPRDAVFVYNIAGSQVTIPWS